MLKNEGEAQTDSELSTPLSPHTLVLPPPGSFSTVRVLPSGHEDRHLRSERKKYCVYKKYAKHLHLCQRTQSTFMSTCCVLGAILEAEGRAMNKSKNPPGEADILVMRESIKT